MVAYKLYFVKYKQISSIDINNIICYADLQQFTNVGISMAEEINKDAGEVLKAFRRDLDIRSAAVRTTRRGSAVRNEIPRSSCDCGKPFAFQGKLKIKCECGRWWRKVSIQFKSG